MKHNIFDGDSDGDKIVGLNFSEVKADALRVGSLKNAVLAHAETYGIGSDRENLELLFPDARSNTDTPSWISRRMEWVAKVLGTTKHTPFSRIKSVHADITADEARAKGYITGNQKLTEVFPVLRRSTTPTTIYKLQKLDRDDIIDITDFDVVRWLKSEMRTMFDEEVARAVLISDGRDPAAQDKISEENVRPIWGDDSLYVHYIEASETDEPDDFIDDVIGSRVEYRGSGNPTCFVSPSLLTTWLLMRDSDGRRLYRTKSELAAEMGVSDVVEVPAMEGLTRVKGPLGSTYTVELKAIVVNLSDYTIGADKGGELGFFDDFDIDFNQYKYLMEARMSGALTVPKSAVVIEQIQGD